ncbi:hypothetical protein FLJC2902T_12320 [Flavobacterium limnosediminis JC2902]|uniref:Uncharacterized protein n=1 Tax=Flavobacterium limnosediminis JC2902 TaxID=1341181 RepID=V6SPU3_9FLAO|nr:hypothetical protein FLJC2902T_12320 [Flavobacterium limnosediminis JC2902]
MKMVYPLAPIGVARSRTESGNMASKNAQAIRSKKKRTSR